ncbi:hypothetical protein [Loktanella sp. SALINAS62]|uniref:hypothetical protein n=1 Tax=Loktanella sp. SALINAS62 TaxID=2706124 RepID=UPI001B8ADC1F|nr:hypothetical protein [Loktanella sp. SALINAS62]MBS1300796.1 hypothetical protein [Loktanella sp. SALINAS62]
MSDPMTNAKIEDVLSSIRRLVAEDDMGAAPAPKPTAKIEKLVLTPALRVDTDNGDSSPTRDPVDDRPAPYVLHAAHAVSDNGPRGHATSLLATIAELEAAVSGQAEEWEDDGTGTDLDKSWSSAGFRGDVAVEDAIEIEPESDGPTVPNNLNGWPATLSEAARIYGGADEDADDSDGDNSAHVLFRHHRARPVETPEPDHDYNDDLMDAPDDEVDHEAEAALHLFLDGGSTIGHAELQDMVRAIVREELQGNLGERITRNVRKLVRREIQRVLSNAEMD